MDTPTTVDLPIRCTSCNASFKNRVATGQRACWRQRSALRENGEALVIYLCDRCSSRFTSEEAAQDFLARLLEDKRTASDAPLAVPA